MKYVAHGKEVLTAEEGKEGFVHRHVADVIGEKEAAFLALAANEFEKPLIVNGEASFDYMAEADRTNSPIFNPQYVDREKFLANLRGVVELGNVLNLYKKLLFRGKSPADLGLLPPLLHESLAVEFDPNNTPDSTLNVLHGAVGVITEAGEVAELLIRAIEDNDRDDVNVLEECGDLRWYIARMLRGIGKTDRECEIANINKLSGRHGATFDVERDGARNLIHERAKLEQDFGAPLLEEPLIIGAGFESADEIVSHDVAERFASGVMPELKLPHTADMDAIAEAERSGQAPNVGIRPIPPGGVRGGVERHEKKPLGDCEGMDC